MEACRARLQLRAAGALLLRARPAASSALHDEPGSARARDPSTFEPRAAALDAGRIRPSRSSDRMGMKGLPAQRWLRSLGWSMERLPVRLVVLGLVLLPVACGGKDEADPVPGVDSSAIRPLPMASTLT